MHGGTKHGCLVYSPAILLYKIPELDEWLSAAVSLYFALRDRLIGTKGKTCQFFEATWYRYIVSSSLFISRERWSRLWSELTFATINTSLRRSGVVIPRDAGTFGFSCVRNIHVTRYQVLYVMYKYNHWHRNWFGIQGILVSSGSTSVRIYAHDHNAREFFWL